VVSQSDAPEYVLVPDGQGGLRMAPKTAGPAAWDSEPAAMDRTTGAEAPRRPIAYAYPPNDEIALDRDEPTLEQPNRGQAMALGLGAGLLALVVGVGVFGHPHRQAPGASAPVAAAAPSSQGLTIVPDAPRAPPALASAALPPPIANPGPANAIPAAAVTAPAAVSRAPTRLALAPSPAEAAAPVVQPPPPPAPVFAREEAPPPRPAAASAEGRGAPASSDEADAGGCGGSAADRMVCADPELGNFDREMHRDLRAAARAGVPLEDLRASQADFTRRREAAAHRSPDAVAEVYDQRIVELERMIDEAPR